MDKNIFNINDNRLIVQGQWTNVQGKMSNLIR